MRHNLCYMKLFASNRCIYRVRFILNYYPFVFKITLHHNTHSQQKCNQSYNICWHASGIPFKKQTNYIQNRQISANNMHRTNIAHPYPKRIYYTRRCRTAKRQKPKTSGSCVWSMFVMFYTRPQLRVELLHTTCMCVCATHFW